MPKPKLLAQDFNCQQELPDWKLAADLKSLQREFTFINFEQAFNFMKLCAVFAEEIDHHPDWCNSWNRVTVSLSTHSANGLTELDITMAHAMNQFSKQIS
jgi:4a-hydroxytetrahydrobiopterin dehydratase